MSVLRLEHSYPNGMALDPSLNRWMSKVRHKVRGIDTTSGTNTKTPGSTKASRLGSPDKGFADGCPPAAVNDVVFAHSIPLQALVHRPQ